MMETKIGPTLQHELSTIRRITLPDFGLLKKQCIAFGVSIPPPVDSVTQIGGYESNYLAKLRDLRLTIPTPVQSHLWPILFRGRSATCISAPKSGKSLSYLVPALSQKQFVETGPDALIYGDEGPKVVVVCSSFNKVNELRIQAEFMKDKRQPPLVLFLTKDNEGEQKSKILNHCDVLIATPGPLQRLIDNGVLRFDICSLLVFDDADRSFTIQPELVQSIVLAYLQSYKKRLDIPKEKLECLLTAPMLVLADSWTKEVKNFSTKYMMNSIQIFGDLFEAAIAHDLAYEITFIPAETDRLRYCSDLIHKLVRRRDGKRIAIVCRSELESAKIVKAMGDLDVEPVLIDSSKSNFEIPRLVEMSRSHPRALTIITDDKIKEFPQLNFIDTLVHYSMPDHTDTFRIRFMLMANLIKKKDQSIKAHFLLSPVNERHAHFLCQSLRRVGDIPDQLEQLRSVSKRPLCDYYLSYAECPFQSTLCLNRHELMTCDQVDEAIPVDGQIKFEITHIINPNQFYIRLLDYRDTKSEKGSWSTFSYQLKSISGQLQSLKDCKTPIEKKPIIGKVYGLFVGNAVHRVKVVDSLGQLTSNETNAPVTENTPYQLEVAFIDLGYNSKALSSNLIPLPKELRDYPSLAFRSFIWGIKPKDNEVEWTHQLSESLRDFLKSNTNLIGSAWIKMQRNSIFWLEGMQLIQNLKNLKRTVVSWSPETDLIMKCLADKNDKMFPNMNTNQSRLLTKWNNHKLWNSVALAFLDDQFTVTNLTHFVDLNQFYVIKQSDYSCLERLEKDLARCDLKRMTEFLPDTLGVGIFQAADQKSYSRIKVIDHLPEEHLVKVFFVDYGETYSIHETFCFWIDPKYIKRLPFQAIKCSLIGIQGKVDPNSIYDLTRTRDEIYTDVLVEKVDGSKESGYSVRVYYESQNHQDKRTTEFIRLTHWLTTEGECQYTSDEEKAIENVKVMPRNVVEEEEIDESEEPWMKGERRCLQNLLDCVDEGMRQILLSEIKPDPVQFDPKKLSPKQRLRIQLKRLQDKRKKAEYRDNGYEYDDENESGEGSSSGHSSGNLSDRQIDYSNILPYDPSDDSEMDSDIEDIGHDEF